MKMGRLFVASTKFKFMNRNCTRAVVLSRIGIDAILCIASTGCQWRQLPKDFPSYSTVQGYFYVWSRGGLFASLNYTLVMASREAAGREASPTAGVIDSQSVKQRKAAAPGATMQARKSRGASATLSPTPKEISSGLSCMKPAFKIATAPLASLHRFAPAIHGFAISLPMVAMPEINCARL
jgi:transposase